MAERVLLGRIVDCPQSVLNCDESFQHCKQVLGVEIIEEAVLDAKFNADANQIENCKFFTGNADDFISSLMYEPGVADQDVLAIVDPPRAGLREYA